MGVGDEDSEEPYTDPAGYDDYEDEDTACLVDDWQETAWDDPEAEWDDFQVFVADEWEKKRNWEFEDPLEQAELECEACLYDMLGDDAWEDPLSCAQFIQDGVCAYVANNKGGKGKGKGKGKHGRYSVRPSNLTIEDRRRKLKDLKSKTECKDCGRRGHWSGDEECTMKNEFKV